MKLYDELFGGAEERKYAREHPQQSYLERQREWRKDHPPQPFNWTKAIFWLLFIVLVVIPVIVGVAIWAEAHRAARDAGTSTPPAVTDTSPSGPTTSDPALNRWKDCMAGQLVGVVGPGRSGLYLGDGSEFQQQAIADAKRECLSFWPYK